jgi:hypothetical protein
MNTCTLTESTLVGYNGKMSTGQWQKLLKFSPIWSCVIRNGAIQLTIGKNELVVLPSSSVSSLG